MSDKTFDLSSASNLFSKVQKVSLGFVNKKEMKTPFVKLYFRSNENKQAHSVFQQLVTALTGERFKLFLNDNGGDYLSLAFLMEKRGVVFSSAPDIYNKRECKDFRLNAFYGDTVKLFFYIETDDADIIVKSDKDGVEINSLDTIYYEYLP